MSLCINPSCKKPSNSNSDRYCLSCGSKLELEGRYRVVRLLSDKGGFSNTYEVEDLQNKQILKVLKVLKQHDNDSIKLFKHEAQVLAQLNHHGIPKGEGSFTHWAKNSETPIYCLIMEKIEGVDLEEYLKLQNFKPISRDLAIDWLFQLARIIKEIHQQELFHRDIKPSNIILKPDRNLVLIDFGASRRVTKTIMTGGNSTQIFTYDYAPPEQQRGHTVPQSDFFALGRTFVFLLTGKHPGSEEIYDVRTNEVKWRKFARHIPSELADFIDELMAEKMIERPENATVVLNQINEVVNKLHSAKTGKQTSPSPSSNPVPKSQQKPQQKSPTVTVLEPEPKSFQPEPSTKPLTLIEPQYAGIWLRFQAAAIDRLLVTATAAIVSAGLCWYLGEKGILAEWGLNFRTNSIDLIINSAICTAIGTTIFGIAIAAIWLLVVVSSPDAFAGEVYNIGILVTIFFGLCFSWFYFIFLESSDWKATIGKRKVGILVINEEGKRLSLAQANKRYWSKILTSMTLYISFFLAGFTKKKRALHDKIAKTIVIKKK
jgi:eukaryotic-like serine/threonine-protein kinase